MNGHFYCFHTLNFLDLTCKNHNVKQNHHMICTLEYSENMYSNKKVYFDLHEINIALRRPKQFDVDR